MDEHDTAQPTDPEASRTLALLTSEGGGSGGGEVLRYNVLDQLRGAEAEKILVVERSDTGQKGLIRVMRVPPALDPHALVRFRIVATAAQRLRHPRVMRVLDFGLTRDGLAYVEAPWVNGIALLAV